MLDQTHQHLLGKWPGSRKIIIPKIEAGEVLSLLFQEDYSLAHLMPPLDNVVNTMRFLQKTNVVQGGYSTVTLFARFRGWSISQPRMRAT